MSKNTDYSHPPLTPHEKSTQTSDDLPQQELVLRFPSKFEAMVNEITKALGVLSIDEQKVIAEVCNKGLSTEEAKSKVKACREKKKVAPPKPKSNWNYDDDFSGGPR